MPLAVDLDPIDLNKEDDLHSLLVGFFQFSPEPRTVSGAKVHQNLAQVTFTVNGDAVYVVPNIVSNVVLLDDILDVVLVKISLDVTPFLFTTVNYQHPTTSYISTTVSSSSVVLVAINCNPFDLHFS